MTWRNLSIVLALLCLYLLWRDCNRPAAAPTRAADAECASPEVARASRGSRLADDRGRSELAAAPADEPAPSDDGLTFNGFKVPAWALWFAPQPGESMLAYRDRMMPFARAAITPHRERVARGREDFAALARLDARQRAELDAAVQEAATAIQDRVLGAALGGELSPSSFKPMTGVALARDVLDTIDRANRRFTASLRDDQRGALAKHPFDFADYLLFSARWEDALGITN